MAASAPSDADKGTRGQLAAARREAGSRGHQAEQRSQKETIAGFSLSPDDHGEMLGPCLPVIENGSRALQQVATCIKTQRLSRPRRIAHSRLFARL